MDDYREKHLNLVRWWPPVRLNVQPTQSVLPYKPPLPNLGKSPLAAPQLIIEQPAEPESDQRLLLCLDQQMAAYCPRHLKSYQYCKATPQTLAPAHRSSPTDRLRKSLESLTGGN